MNEKKLLGILLSQETEEHKPARIENWLIASDGSFAINLNPDNKIHLVEIVKTNRDFAINIQYENFERHTTIQVLRDSTENKSKEHLAYLMSILDNEYFRLIKTIEQGI